MLQTCNYTYEQALSIVESWRYRYGTHESLCAFIDKWAYDFTGLYPMQSKISNDVAFFEDGNRLARILSELMLGGLSDPISRLFCDACPSFAKQYGFYPTPDGLVNLLNALILPTPNETNEPVKVSLYEPCVGPAGSVLEALDHIATTGHRCANPLENTEIVVEDINSYAVKAFFLQLMHKIAYLQNTISKQIMPKRVEVLQLDTLSRRPGKVSYQILAKTSSINGVIETTKRCHF